MATRTRRYTYLITWILFVASVLASHVILGQTSASRTQVVMLGTGTPRADPARSGPATAIVVNGSPYLIDFGPGVVRRAQAAFDKGITGLSVEKLDIAFVTHLHSDHTVGYPDLIFTTWVQGRDKPLRVYGPKGIVAMTSHVLMAWQADIDIRTKGFEQRNPAGAVVEAHDIEQPGVVFKDSNVTVTAFPVLHGDVPQAFGYRFDTPDRTIVISGDANPSPALIENCRKCDILIHEAFSLDYTPAKMPNWIEYRARFHTTTAQLAEIARKTEPKLLVLYHRGVRRAGGEISDEQYLAEVRRTYSGKVVIAHDLDVY
jgi:ribonuclease BN (tRNA processing enzyme)